MMRMNNNADVIPKTMVNVSLESRDSWLVVVIIISRVVVGGADVTGTMFTTKEKLIAC